MTRDKIKPILFSIINRTHIKSRKPGSTHMTRDKIKPILFSIIKHQDPEQLKRQIPRDIVAGIVVAIVALPLSIALAIASGVGPEQGLYTAIVAGFIIALLGGGRRARAGPLYRHRRGLHHRVTRRQCGADLGSHRRVRHHRGGHRRLERYGRPGGRDHHRRRAFATIVAGIVASSGMDGLVAATIIAGVLLILMGVFRLGTLIRFVPYTITTGFTAGIAVAIVAGQLKDLFGLTYPAGTPTIETMDKLSAVAANFSTSRRQCGADLGSHRRVRHHRGGHRRLERYGRPGGRDHHRRRASDPHGRLSPGHAHPLRALHPHHGLHGGHRGDHRGRPLHHHRWSSAAAAAPVELRSVPRAAAQRLHHRDPRGHRVPAVTASPSRSSRPSSPCCPAWWPIP